MRLLYVGIIALALLAGPATTLNDDAHAGGFIEEINKHEDVRYYLHGDGDPRFLTCGRYADVTLKIDGETVFSDMRVYNGRGRMGGSTTSRLAYDANVYVKFVFYESDGRRIREDTWNKELKEGINKFNHWDSTWKWGLLLLLDRTNPRVDLNTKYVDVMVRLD